MQEGTYETRHAATVSVQVGTGQQRRERVTAQQHAKAMRRE